MTLKEIKKNFPFSGKFGDCRLCSYIRHCEKILPGLHKPGKCGGPFFPSEELSEESDDGKNGNDR